MRHLIPILIYVIGCVINIGFEQINTVNTDDDLCPVEKQIATECGSQVVNVPNIQIMEESNNFMYKPFGDEDVQMPVTVISGGTYSDKRKMYYLENLKYFHIIINSDICYQVYDQNEEVTPFSCRNKIDVKKLSCIDWLDTKETCLGIKTPTNESIELICNTNGVEDFLQYYRVTEGSCFKVYKSGREETSVCFETIQNYSIGITTPDKFTLLLDSYYCHPLVSKSMRNSYKIFINDFSFDPEIRSCFKIYNNNQQPTPYTCLSDDVHDSCLQQFPQYNNCYGIITQKNDTVILKCQDHTKLLSRKNCFKIYDINNNEYTSCVEKLEERCVGFKTLSNLTILVECYFCSIPYIKQLSFYPSFRREYRRFVEEYIKNEYLGENSYLNNIIFEVFQQKNFVRPTNNPINGAFGYWIPNSSCYGITLENNETIVLECVGTNKTQLQPGCFKIINSEQEEHSSCMEILEERCVGITTPGKLYVAFACYKEYNGKNMEKVKNIYSERPAEQFILIPHLHNCYELYKEHQILEDESICQKTARPENYTCIDWIEREDRHCLGLKTPANETIEILCADTKEAALLSSTNNCFSVYRDDVIVTQICKKKFGDHIVGITTPNNYSILFHSYFCETVKSKQVIEQFKSFVENFSFESDIRSCYKIYTEDQDVSPKSCLDKKIYESCVRQVTKTNCTGIITQNNETVILTCSGNDADKPVDGCFKIYTFDGKIHVSCQEKLEESCMGIRTPSNLKILFECATCSYLEVQSLHSYTSNERKRYRPYVEQALQIYMIGNYTFQPGDTVKISRPEQSVAEIDCDFPISIYPVHILHDFDDCFGVTMETHETIVLECPGKQSKELGCFDVYGPINIPYNDSPHRKVQNVCVKIINEQCVGITTPGNWTLSFSCVPFGRGCLTAAVSVPRNGEPLRI